MAAQFRAIIFVGIVLAFGVVASGQEGETPDSPFDKAHDEIVAKVDAAVAKGAAYLLTRQDDAGTWPARSTTREEYYDYPASLTALATYAILSSGVGPSDPSIAASLDYLADLDTGLTYNLALQARVWQLADARSGGTYRRLLEKNVRGLLALSPRGRFSYNKREMAHGKWDNSCGHYGAYGVAAGMEAGMPISRRYWEAVAKH